MAALRQGALTRDADDRVHRRIAYLSAMGKTRADAKDAPSQTLNDCQTLRVVPLKTQKTALYEYLP